MSKKSDKKVIPLPAAEWERDLLDGNLPTVAQQYPQPNYAYPTVYAPPAYAGSTAMGTYRTVGANVMADNDATVATVHYNGSYQDKTGWHELDFSATGSSKRERGDSYDREIGELLASARALEKMAARMKRRAKGLIRTQDSIVQHRRTAAEKRAQSGMPDGIDLPAMLSDLFAGHPNLRVISPDEFFEKIQERLEDPSDEPVVAEFPNLDSALDALKNAAIKLGEASQSIANAAAEED